MRDQDDTIDSGVFLTGATGFIGLRVAHRLAAQFGARVRCLTRKPGPEGGAGPMTTVIGDLRVPETYRRQLRAGDIVLHLAGLTGKARRADYFATNVDGTRALLDASRRAGVRAVVFVSSIAATYSDKRAYHYAESKALAEQCVRDSGLAHAIVRPTIVLGSGSPIGEKLAILASLPILTVIGDGKVRLQPVHVDDVAAFLVAMVNEPAVGDRAVNVGGPDVITFESLLKRIRRAQRRRDGLTLHLPARAIIRTLAATEPLSTWLPFSAGQLSAFVNDSVAGHDPFVAAKVPHMTTIDEMVRQLTANG